MTEQKLISLIKDAESQSIVVNFRKYRVSEQDLETLEKWRS